MRILGIDTANKILNLAVTNDGELITDYRIDNTAKTHSANIIGLLNSMLELNCIKLDTIEGIAVSIGPGSFTGLRIGLSTAKGLAYALSIPIVGVNTLDSYAYCYLGLDGYICSLIEARKGEYYFAIYDNKGNVQINLDKYRCEKWNIIKKELFKVKEKVYVVGHGISNILQEELIDKTKQIDNINFLTDCFINGNAANVALIGETKIKSKLDDDIFQLIPFYIGKSSAEMKISK